jgi:MarR family transcriptional regulator, lower aerobic nicotinate degradation pathway regulator
MSRRGVRADYQLFRYILDKQAGFMFRVLKQRHDQMFSREIEGKLTTAQWAALSKLAEVQKCTQNRLGRLTSMDGATIKGVVDRLTDRGLTQTRFDLKDRRRVIVSLTRKGRDLVSKLTPQAISVTNRILESLDPQERVTLTELLKRLIEPKSSRQAKSSALVEAEKPMLDAVQ